MRESYFQVGMRTRSFERLFGSIGLGHFCIGLPFVLISSLWHPPFFCIMEDSTSSKQSAASAMTDGQPTSGMDTVSLMHQLLASLEQQGAGSSQSAGESICIILFGFVFILFPPFHCAWSVILTGGLCHYSMQSIVVQCNAIQVKGQQPEPPRLWIKQKEGRLAGWSKWRWSRCYTEINQ